MYFIIFMTFYNYIFLHYSFLYTTSLYNITSLSFSCIYCNPFCLLRNSPYILYFSIILFLLLYINISLFFLQSISIIYNYLYLQIYVSGCVLFLYYCFRDILRELYKKYEILLILLYQLFFIFLISELILFISFFICNFYSFSSIILGILFGESFILPYPSLLSFTNIFLLSMAAIFLGNSFISLEIISSSYIIFLYFIIIFSYMFLSLQIKEFLYMNLFINDSIYSSLFFFLTGLHFFHLFFGLFLLFLLFWSCSYSS